MLERISIVIPLNNESEELSSLLYGIHAAMIDQAIPWELIAVDDGSTDDTLDVLRSHQTALNNLTILSYKTRCGQSAAVWSGLAIATGTILVTMDGDGQQDPADICLLIQKILEGYDFVIGQRTERADPFSKCLFSNVCNRLRRLLTRSSIPETGCSLRAFRQTVVADLIPFTAFHRFLPTMIELSGHRLCVVPVRHYPRPAGRSHYGVVDRFSVSIVDGLAVWWLKGKRRLPIAVESKVYPPTAPFDSSGRPPAVLRSSSIRHE